MQSSDQWEAVYRSCVLIAWSLREAEDQGRDMADMVTGAESKVYTAVNVVNIGLSLWP